MTPFEEIYEFVKDVAIAQVKVNHASNLKGIIDPKTYKLTQEAHDNHIKTLILANILDEFSNIAGKQALKERKDVFSTPYSAN